MVVTASGQYTVHHTGLAQGERLQRELQRQTQRQVSEHGDFTTLKEAQILNERPHSSLGYKSPAPQAILPASTVSKYGTNAMKPEPARF